MGFKHGRHAVVILNGSDISAFCNTHQAERNADKHDVTTYGKDDHVFSGGLGNGAQTIGGIYDDGATGPRAVIEPLIGTVVTYVRRPLGTGTGLPQDSLNVLVEKYVETTPVADMITWSVDLQPSDAVDSTVQ